MEDYPKGLDPYTSRQYLLHHMYSPLISVDSSRGAEVLLQLILQSEVSFLSVLKPYGNNVRYGIPNQSFKITNTQLITKHYPSFPVRFEFSLPDLLSIKNASNPNSIPQLFSISSLEMLLKKFKPESNDLYLQFINKIITSNSIVPFDTFNHPIAQIFIIDFESDSVDDLRAKIVEFRNYNFPKFFQLSDLLIHVFVVYDDSKFNQQELNNFESAIKSKLSLSCTCIPIVPKDTSELIKIHKNENSTIEEDLQTLSFNSTVEHFLIPQQVDTSIRMAINSFICTHLIPHMEKYIRVWDDQVLAPKKSITNRFFSASKKLFNNNSNSGNNANDSQSSGTSFNYQENYYYKSSPEQTIRKLADWSLILKDFKYSYSIYDFIKKDFTNDKAWVYVASTQEMCIVSLLLAQTQLVNSQSAPPDKNTLRKIKHDIIEPYLDNLSYTYKSRLNLKTYNLRSQLMIVELLLCMCSSFNMYWWWIDLLEKYLIKSINEFDSHLISGNHSLQVIKAILYERLGYIFGKYSMESLYEFNQFNQHNSRHMSQDVKHFNDNLENQEEEHEKHEDQFYHNVHKLTPKQYPHNFNNKLRKSAIWYLISIKQWMSLKHYDHIKFLLQNMNHTFDLDLTENWYDRSDLLLGFVKRCLNEFESESRESNTVEDPIPDEKEDQTPQEPSQ